MPTWRSEHLLPHDHRRSELRRVVLFAIDCATVYCFKRKCQCLSYSSSDRSPMFRLIKLINCYNSRYPAKTALSEMTLQNFLSVFFFFFFLCSYFLVVHSIPYISRPFFILPSFPSSLTFLNISFFLYVLKCFASFFSPLVCRSVFSHSPIHLSFLHFPISPFIPFFHSHILHFLFLIFFHSYFLSYIHPYTRFLSNSVGD